jgi:hypothetical protein
MSGKRSMVPDTDRITKEITRKRYTIYGGSAVQLPDINSNHRSSFYSSAYHQNKNNNVKVYKEESER